MKANSRILLAAIIAVGAICALAFPAIAGCPEDDPTCKLIPLESREVRVVTSEGYLVFSDADLSNALASAPMPPPVLLQPVAPVIASSSTTPEFTTITLPLRHQDPLDVSCGAQALGMALEPLEGAAPSSAAILDFLRRHDYLYEFGTGVEELALTAQEFGYVGSVSFHNWRLENLQAELAAGRPVVVDLGANGVDAPGHFVALTGISPDGKLAAYSDPLLGERVVPLDEFLGRWALQGNSGVAVAEAPPAPLSPDHAPWTALAAAMMATLALGPSVLADVRRKGIGGRLVAEGSSGGATTHVGMDPPHAAPEGMGWVRGEAVYKTRTRTEIVYHQIPKRELQKVLVGTTTKKIPYTKRILVDNGHWVTDYKTERYIKGYRRKRILDGYKTRRYVKCYRTKLYRNRWGGYSRRRVPLYGTKRVPVYRTMRVPIYGTRKVANGRHWESKWVYEEHTEYKTVVKPVYEEQWVTVGYEWIPEEKIIKEQITVGYHWALEGLKHPPPAKSEIDIIDETSDIRASIPRPQRMVTTAPLRIRSSPGAESASLAIAVNGAEMIWTGTTQVLDTGATWYQVRYDDPNKGLVSGWVHSGYIETPVRIPEPSTEAGSNIDTSRRDALRQWLHYFTPEEQAAYIASEKLRLEAFWSEIRKLTLAQDGLERGVMEGLVIRDEVKSLLQKPKWYVNGGMPDSFYEEHLFDEETLRALQNIILNPAHLSAEVTDRTWEILSAAFHCTEADLKTHLFSNASWGPESMTSVGSFPIELFVTRQHGHYLLTDPSPGSGNVTEAFLGVPHGEKVTWDGTYELGVDSSGDEVVYYHVSWVFNGRTYRGWIPNKYLAPEVKSWGAESSSGGDGTYGYGDGTEAWWKYYIGTGSAQNLDLSKLMKELGFEDYDQYAKPHKNLCGWLAAMEGLGIPLEEGFRILAKLYPEKLKDGQAQANASELTQFINEFSTDRNSANTKHLITNLIASYKQGNKVIALVALDVNNKLCINEENARSGHWIRIRSINDSVVSYFDSLSNSVKEVTREVFEQAWANSQYVAENSILSANMYIEAAIQN